MGRLEIMRLKKEKARSNFKIFLELSKPNILSLVLVATFLGYYLGNMGLGSIEVLTFTLIGTAMTAAGSGALNHYLEREADGYMSRTQNRPLPAKLISPNSALIYGIVMTIFGSILLVLKVNTLTGFLALLTAFLYILVYTPLK